MKRTFNYNFIKLESGDMLYESDEIERWTTVDNNLRIVTDTCGDGVLSGWEVTLVDGGVSVSSGSGFISGIYVANTTETPLLSIPAGVYFVYAELHDGVTTNPRFTVTVGYTETDLTSTQIELAKISVV
jgi:hypothetical protein